MEGARGPRHERANPINPQRVFWELSPKLPDRLHPDRDSGSSANWYARDLKFGRGMMASLSGNLATMGPGVPYAIAAKFAHPDRVGDCDGGRRRDADEWYQRTDHDREVLARMERSPAPRAGARQSRLEPGDLGAARVCRRSQIRGLAGLPDFPSPATPSCWGSPESPWRSRTRSHAGWDQALAAQNTMVIEAHTDPEVPPLPPHITFDQAKAYAQAIVKGDPGGWDMVKQSVKQMVESYVHR